MVCWRLVDFFKFSLFLKKTIRMHFLKYIFPFLFTVILFSNCTNDGSASTQEAAKSICKCSEPLVEINQQMEVKKKEGKIEELTNLMGKAGEAMEKAIACTQENIDEKMNRENLRKALEKTCGINKRMAEDLVGKLE